MGTSKLPMKQSLLLPTLCLFLNRAVVRSGRSCFPKGRPKDTNIGLVVHFPNSCSSPASWLQFILTIPPDLQHCSYTRTSWHTASSVLHSSGGHYDPATSPIDSHPSSDLVSWIVIHSFRLVIVVGIQCHTTGKVPPGPVGQKDGCVDCKARVGFQVTPQIASIPDDLWTKGPD